MAEQIAEVHQPNPPVKWRSGEIPTDAKSMAGNPSWAPKTQAPARRKRK